MEFKPHTDVMGVGTGGGFPAVPLAILFPETNFYAIDVIAKKIRVVNEVATSIELKNLKAEQKRAELVTDKFDFIVSRAVTNMPDFVSWVKGKIKKQSVHELKNGILYLKGGDLAEELQDFRSEEHTSELQSRPHLVCRLLLEKKNNIHQTISLSIPTFPPSG